jgi:hypothetical protein
LQHTYNHLLDKYIAIEKELILPVRLCVPICSIPCLFTTLPDENEDTAPISRTVKSSIMDLSVLKPKSIKLDSYDQLRSPMPEGGEP